MPRSNKKPQHLNRKHDAAGAPAPTHRFARKPQPTGASARMKSVQRRLPNTRSGFRG